MAALLASTLWTPSALAQTAPVKGCAAAGYHQLDFWVGEWNVHDTAKGYQVGTSKIASVLDGCAIHEAYEAPEAPSGAYAGRSYSAFEPATGGWHQYYVDTTGSTTWFTGGLEGSSMVLYADGKKPGVKIRMSYIPSADGSLRQIGESSADGGKTWAPSYDYTYRKR